jgi:hypothetical protein
MKTKLNLESEQRAAQESAQMMARFETGQEMRTQWVALLSEILGPVRFVTPRCFPTRTIFAAILGIVVMPDISVAQALPNALATASVQAGNSTTDNQQSVGPVTMPLTLSSGKQENSWISGGQLSWYSADSHVDVGFGSGGNIQADAAVAVGGWSQAWASAGGGLDYSVTLRKTGTTDFDPGIIPISFGASGSGEVTGAWGRFNADACVVGAVSGSCNAFHIQYEGSADSRSFSDMVTYDIRRDSLTATTYSYRVTLAATASAFAGTATGTEESSVSVMVDPIMGFDQAAFDTMYGTLSFQLSDYYTMEFSPNLTAAIPEPETYAMLLAGLGLLGFMARRRKQKEAAA